jgi:hypothetical protein
MRDPAEHLRRELERAHRTIADLRLQVDSLQRALTAAGVALQPYLGKSSEQACPPSCNCPRSRRGEPQCAKQAQRVPIYPQDWNDARLEANRQKRRDEPRKAEDDLEQAGEWTREQLQVMQDRFAQAMARETRWPPAQNEKTKGEGYEGTSLAKKNGVVLFCGITPAPSHGVLQSRTSPVLSSPGDSEGKRRGPTMGDPRNATYQHLHDADDPPPADADAIKLQIVTRENQTLKARIANLEQVVRVATKTLSPYAVPPRTKR